MKLLILIASILSFSMTVFAANCSAEKVGQENKELKTSPYWKAKVDEMMKVLTEERARGCPENNGKTSGMAIVSDDIEFVGTDKNRMFSKSLDFTECKKGYSNEINVYQSGEGFLEGKTEVVVSTPKGSLRFLANTCSPKEAIANFIPASKMALKAACGHHQIDGKEADIKIQTDAYAILKGDKEPKKAAAAATM